MFHLVSPQWSVPLSGLVGGTLATSPLTDRLLACALALAAFYMSRKNLFVGVITGVAVLIAAGYMRGLFAFG